MISPSIATGFSVALTRSQWGYGTTARCTRGRGQGSWDVSASAPPQSHDSKTLDVSGSLVSCLPSLVIGRTSSRYPKPRGSHAQNQGSKVQSSVLTSAQLDHRPCCFRFAGGGWSDGAGETRFQVLSHSSNFFLSCFIANTCVHFTAGQFWPVSYSPVGIKHPQNLIYRPFTATSRRLSAK